MKKKSLKKALFVFIPLGALIFLALIDPNIEKAGQVFKSISPYWLVFSFLSMLLYFYFDVLMYRIACKNMGIPQKFFDSIITTMVGFFYSALTPFSSGGQPMQVIQMRKRGIKVGIATSVLMLKFMAWQGAITLVGLLGFIYCFKAFNIRASLVFMYVFGFFMYSGTLLLGFLAFLRPDFLFERGKSLISFLHRRRIIKKEERLVSLQGMWARTVSDFREAVSLILKYKASMMLVFFVAFIEAVAYMAVTYFIYRGLGLKQASFFYVVLLQGFLYICVSFIPLPGASIASEGGFYLVFSQLFPPEARFPALLIWRIITYYSTLLLGLGAVIIDSVRAPSLYNGSNGNDTSFVSLPFKGDTSFKKQV